jgi:hypothetical protein
MAKFKVFHKSTSYIALVIGTSYAASVIIFKLN